MADSPGQQRDHSPLLDDVLAGPDVAPRVVGAHGRMTVFAKMTADPSYRPGTGHIHEGGP